MDNIKLDEFEEVIILVGDKGDENEFREIALIDFNGKNFICLEPVQKIDGFEDGDLLIYEISFDENEGEIFLPVCDEKLLADVFEEFLKLQKESENEE